MKTPNSVKMNSKTPMVLILIVTAFAGGLLLGNSGLLNNRGGAVANSNLPFDEAYIQQIYNKVQSDHLGTNPTADEVTHSIAKGLIESLNDPYSAYLNPQEAQDYLKLSDSAYDGIGVSLGFNDQYTTVETVMDGFPAQQAGVKNGDVIVSVDDVDMAKSRPEVVSGKIKGLAGTNVKLGLYRESEAKMLTITVTRAEIKLDNITYDKLANGVVQIHIGKFTEGAKDGLSGPEVFNRDWDNTVAEIAALNPKGIIVDLRNNPGGYVDAVRHVMEEFLSDGQVMMREQQKGKDEVVYRDNRGGKFETVPMAVLVNEGSASASEIFSGAIHDNNRGKIVGEKTVGKGVEQELLPLQDNSLLLLVFQKWLTPNSVQISKESPITPDFIVEYAAASSSTTYDSQLTKALETIGF